MPLGPDLTASERSDVGGLRGQNFVALVLAEAWAAHSTALPGAVSRCARWEEMLRNYFETVEWIEWNPNLFPRKFGSLQRVILKRSYSVVYFFQEAKRSIVVAVLDGRREPRANKKLLTTRRKSSAPPA